MGLNSATWEQRPQVPDDLSAVSMERLADWKSRLGLLILDIQNQQGQAINRLRVSVHMPRGEYLELCDWQRRASSAKLSMQRDLTRIRQQIRARSVSPTKGTPGKAIYRDRLMDLLDNLASDTSLSEGSRGAADAFLCFLEQEDDERAKR